MTAFDPRRILSVLASHGVEHVVIGGVGGVLHGSPLRTDDLDVVPALTSRNLGALADALNEMHARIRSHEVPEGLSVEWVAQDLRRWLVDFVFLHLMTDYGRLDLIHRPAGTAGYRDLAPGAEALEVDHHEVRVAALEDIIRSKQAVGRERDLEQLPTLRLLLESKKAAFLPGQEVIVPWELSEVPGTIVEILGVGPRARALVRVRVPGGGEEEMPFPLRDLRPST